MHEEIIKVITEELSKKKILRRIPRKSIRFSSILSDSSTKENLKLFLNVFLEEYLIETLNSFYQVCLEELFLKLLKKNRGGIP